MTNDLNSLLDWVCSIRTEVTEFMSRMKKSDGTYKYTFSGDLYPETVLSNLGANVFALKIFYVLDVKKDEKLELVIDHIKKFQQSDGLFWDQFVFNKSFLRNFASSIRRGRLYNLTNWQYKVAETRQCISALGLYDHKPEFEPSFFPKKSIEVEEYLEALNWQHPWDAGSHFSHLCFFLSRLQDGGDTDASESLDLAFSWISKLQDPQSGCWWRGKRPSDGELINGAMKVLTGYEAAGRSSFKYADSLINFCLNTVNNTHACGNFNILYVLDTAQQNVNGIARRAELETFVYERLKIFKAYWFAEYGGFSFHPNKSSENYYGARVSKGLNEPDIHGTVMFIWGLSLISRLLDIDDKTGLRPFST